MGIRSKNWIIALSVLLSFSLLLPFCCHTDVTWLFGHQQEMQSHADHSQQPDSMPECNCGHELTKDYQKTKKSMGNPGLISGAAIVLVEQSIPALSKNNALTPILIPPGLLDDSGPPVHLLISVFLN